MMIEIGFPMNLKLDESLAFQYKSNSQKARIITERWAKENTYCPSCGNNLKQHTNNKPVADFFCCSCLNDFELKSSGTKLGNTISDGAYETMINRLNSNNNPHLLLLHYNKKCWEAANYLVIPKYFFTPDIIIKRPPLSANARRSGWIGCNINISSIPQNGKIFLVKDGIKIEVGKVMSEWSKTSFLASEDNINSRGWLISIIRCIENMSQKEFNLDEMYKYEKHLHAKFPNNNHIKEKIRQQLQVLRDKGYLEFIKKGSYRLI